jgi:hypothetical protein
MIYGLAAVVGQARKSPPSPIQLMWQLPAAQELYQHLPTPPPPPNVPTFDYVLNITET